MRRKSSTVGSNFPCACWSSAASAHGQLALEPAAVRARVPGPVAVDLDQPFEDAPEALVRHVLVDHEPGEELLAARAGLLDVGRAPPELLDERDVLLLGRLHRDVRREGQRRASCRSRRPCRAARGSRRRASHRAHAPRSAPARPPATASSRSSCHRRRRRRGRTSSSRARDARRPSARPASGTPAGSKRSRSVSATITS